MNILWLNWRDIKNPQAGGAEVMTQETAKRLVRDGHRVTLFTSKVTDCPTEETISGVKIIRHGNLLTCRFWAYRYYQKHLKGDVDLVIDEINTLPFFIPLYVKERKIALIHQLAREYWFMETFFPLNLIGFLLEPLYLKVYSNTPTICASVSTKKDLESLGFKRLYVFHQGLSLIPPKTIPPKPKNPQILFMGRLTQTKGFLDALYAFQIIHNCFHRAKLNLCVKGKSTAIKKLENKIVQLKLNRSVEIHGDLNPKEKVTLLKKSQITLLPSIREGWCLVAIESCAFGSIPVGYNVPGLCDSIKDKKTGMLCSKNTPENLASLAITILQNRKLKEKLSKNGLSWAKQFSWEETYQSITHTIFARPAENRTCAKLKK